MVRKTLGHLVGTAVFIVGFYFWFVSRGGFPPGLAWREALKLGLLYLTGYALLDRLVPSG